MSFYWKEYEDVTIINLTPTILGALIECGWTETDPGYDVVTSADGKFDLGITLETSTKRFLQFKIGDHGMWNTGIHAWNGTEMSYGHVIEDSTGAVGTEPGILKMAFDDSYVIVITDYTNIGATFRRCCSFGGLAEPLNSSDECLTFGSSLFAGSTASPTNSSTTVHRTKLLRDIVGGLTYPVYLATFLTPEGALENGSPALTLLSATVDKRLLPYLYLSAYAAVSEQAGVRCSVPSMFIGGSKDPDPYGAIIRTVDGKEYFYFQQSDDYLHCHFATRLLVRCT